MAQPSSRLPRQTPPQPFSQGQDPAVTSGLFWTRLVTYRPLFLLGGLWAVLVGLSAIAYQGLMFNEPVEVYEQAPLTLAPAQPPDLDTNTPGDPAAAAPQSGTVALWGLVSLVGLCSFGCFVIAQQIKASARPKRKPKPTARPRPAAKAPQPQGPKRLAPYSPQRDGVVVPGVRIVESPPMQSPPMQSPPVGSPRVGSPPVESPWVEAPTQMRAAVPKPAPPKLKAPQSKTAQKQRVKTPQKQKASRRPLINLRALAPQPRPKAADPTAPPRPAPAPPPASSTPSPTTVVPDGDDLSLDYPEGSVAHALDVRQRRSLSSFM